MTSSTRMIGSLAVTVALAVPATAFGQAVARNSGSTSNGSSSGGGSGASGGGGNSGGGASEGTRVSPPSSMSSGSSSYEPSRIPRTSGNTPSRTGGGEGTRVAPPPGGVAGVTVSALTAPNVSGTAAGRAAMSNASISEAVTSARVRGTEGSRGTAVARPLPVLPAGDFVSFPFYGPWGGWYPWCYSGFGWGVGFLYYDPWFYGPTSWYWGRYGMWYDPSAYFIDPYLSGGSSGSSGSSREETTGSIRIKSNVPQAQVFVDGALAGVVDEFDGLRDHLEVDAGKHSIELRADGYATVSTEIVVASGKTRTLRLDLKKPVIK